VQVVVRLTPKTEAVLEPAFTLLLADGRARRGGAFAASVIIHFVLIVVASLVKYATYVVPDGVPRHTDHIVFFQFTAPKPQANLIPPKVLAPQVVERAVAAAQEAASPSASAPPARRFEAPVVTARRVETQQILLQPDADVPAIPKDIVVPSMVLLNRALNQRTFVQPPKRERAILPAQPAILDMPVQMLGDQAVLVTSNKLPLDRMPALPAPRGTPVAISGDKHTATPPESISTGLGSDPVSIISVPTQALPLAESIAIPKIQMAGSGGAIAAGPGGLARTPSPGAAPNGRTDSGTGTGSGNVKSATGSGEGTTPRAASNSRAGSGDGTGAGPGGPGNGDASIATDPPFVKLVRTPAKDFVVTQTNSFIPGTAGLLTGRPVYTVYVGVGQGRDWILQYCLPPDGTAVVRNSNVVQAGSATPVSTPYALVIFRPPVQFKAGFRYAFVHGTINVSGRLENARMVGPPALGDPQMVLRALQQWSFQPASKDGISVAVEVLICIPNAA
jgi:hypothetical protein